MSVQSLDRALDVLELLAQGRSGMKLVDIAGRLGLHKSTAHRLLGALKDRGYVEQRPDTGLYRLGLRLIALSSDYLQTLEIKTEAEPFLRRLSERLGETVFLATLQDDHVVYLDKVEGFESLRRYAIIGRRAPVYCTSLGRSLVLDFDDHSLRDLLGRVSIQRRTEATVTDPKRLIDLIASFRRRGWSEDIEENERGVSCVGAPVRDYRGTVIAAISSAWEGPRDRQFIERMGESLRATAGEISEHLGCFDYFSHVPAL